MISTSFLLAKVCLSYCQKGTCLTTFRQVSTQVINNVTKQKPRLQCTTALLDQLKIHDKKCMFFTDQKNFCLNPPVGNQNSRVWATGKKADVKPSCVLVQHETFVQHATVSAGMSFHGNGRLHFLDEKAKVDSAYYVGRLLPNLVKDCTRLLPTGFISQQDAAPAHSARITQDWIQANCPDYCQRSVASKFARPKHPGLLCLRRQCWRLITSTIQNSH